MPLGIKLSGGDDPVWFLALYLPKAWQWPTIAAMVALGLATYGLVARTYLRHARKARHRATAQTVAASPNLGGRRDVSPERGRN